MTSGKICENTRIINIKQRDEIKNLIQTNEI